MVLSQWEIRTSSTRVWTRVTVSSSFYYNRYGTITSKWNKKILLPIERFLLPHYNHLDVTQVAVCVYLPNSSTTRWRRQKDNFLLKYSWYERVERICTVLRMMILMKSLCSHCFNLSASLSFLGNSNQNSLFDAQRNIFTPLPFNFILFPMEILNRTLFSSLRGWCSHSFNLSGSLSFQENSNQNSLFVAQRNIFTLLPFNYILFPMEILNRTLFSSLRGWCSHSFNLSGSLSFQENSNQNSLFVAQRNIFTLLPFNFILFPMEILNRTLFSSLRDWCSHSFNLSGSLSFQENSNQNSLFVAQRNIFTLLPFNYILFPMEILNRTLFSSLRGWCSHSFNLSGSLSFQENSNQNSLFVAQRNIFTLLPFNFILFPMEILNRTLFSSLRGWCSHSFNLSGSLSFQENSNQNSLFVAQRNIFTPLPFNFILFPMEILNRTLFSSLRGWCSHSFNLSGSLSFQENSNQNSLFVAQRNIFTLLPFYFILLPMEI